MTEKLSKTGAHRSNSCQARHFLFFILFCFNSIASAEQAHWQSTDYIVDSFIDIALNNEYSTDVSLIRKWTQPIEYTIIHRTADQSLHQKITELHLSHLASITDLEIRPTPIETQANLKIIFSTEALLNQELKNDFLLADEQHISELAHKSVCLAHFSTNPDNSIRHAVVIIPVDRARAHAKLLSCVVEELTQIMGLPNDSENVFPSIFNDKSFNDYLSGLDFLLLKLLYHPQIKIGMYSYQLRKQLPALINEDPFQQLIKKAESLVNEQGLYLLLN